jgi:signal transduction histidine kinase
MHLHTCPERTSNVSTHSGLPEGGRPTSGGGSMRAGRGILGMRERCELLGGELDARPIPGGGFEVTARLPLAPTGSAYA